MKDTTKEIISSKLFPKNLPEDFVIKEFRRAYAYNIANPINENEPVSARRSFEQWMKTKGVCTDGKKMSHSDCLQRKYKEKIDYDTSPKYTVNSGINKRRTKQNKNQKSLHEILYG